MSRVFSRIGTDVRSALRPGLKINAAWIADDRDKYGRSLVTKVTVTASQTLQVTARICDVHGSGMFTV